MTISQGDALQGYYDADNKALHVAPGEVDYIVTVTPTVLNSDAYDASDLLFDSTEIVNAVRVNGGIATLKSLTLLDKADQKAIITLVFANALTDFGAPDGAPDPDDTECETVLGTVAIAAADYFDLGGASVVSLKNINLPLKAASTTTSLWVAGVAGASTPTYATGCLVLQLGFART